MVNVGIIGLGHMGGYHSSASQLIQGLNLVAVADTNVDNLISMPENYMMPDLTHISEEPLHVKEMYEGFIIVDFVPTSENLSAWLLNIVQKKMAKINIKVSHIEYFETPKSKSTVYA